MNLLDRAIEAVSPGWALRRQRSRFILEHSRGTGKALQAISAAAARDRLTNDWRHPVTSADQWILGDMAAVNSRVRMLVRDDPVAASIVKGFRRHIIGTGITSRASAKDPETGEVSEQFKRFNRQADLFFGRLTRPQVVDIERKRSLVGCQSQTVKEWSTVGQHFIAMRRDPRGISPVGFVLQTFEPEQLWTERTETADGAREIRGGIEVDEFGAAVGYWFGAKGHRLEATSNEAVRIPAEDVFHFMDVDRPWQSHGVSPLISVVRKLRHTQLYDEYQLLAAQGEAAYMAVIERAMPSGGNVLGLATPSDSTTADDAGNTFTDIQPAMVAEVGPGDKVNWHTPSRPGEVYEPYIKAQHHLVSAGAGLDYPTVMRDFTGATYSGQRQAMIERNYDTDATQLLVVELFLIPFRERVTEIAIMLGLLEAPGFLEDEAMRAAYLSVDWRAQAKPWVDPENHANATKISLGLGLSTKDQVLNELGRPPHAEQCQMLAAEKEIEDELGLNLTGEPVPAARQVPVRQLFNPLANHTGSNGGRFQ